MDKIDTVSRLSGIAVAIIAVAAFIVSIMDDREERHADGISSWRKAAIQEMLQNAPNNELKIDDILSKTRSLAWEDQNLKIDQDDLSEEQVRILLVEMISLGIIDQNKDDMYGLRFALKTTSVTGVEDDIRKGREFRKALLDALRERPRHYTLDTIFFDIAKPIGLDRVEYKAVMDMFEKNQTIEIDEAGKISLKQSRRPG